MRRPAEADDPSSPPVKAWSTLQLPRAVGLRLQLVDDAEAVGASGGSHAVEIAMPVEGQAASGAGAVVASGELVDHGLGPGSAGVGQLENDAAAAFTRASAAGDGCAIDVAVSVERDAFVGFAAIGCRR